MFSSLPFPSSRPNCPQVLVSPIWATTYPDRKPASSGHIFLVGQNAYVSAPTTLDPYGHTARPSSRNGAQGRGLRFFLSFFPFFLFAFCFLLFAFCFDFFNRHITGCKTTNGGARWQFVLFEYEQLDAPHVVTNRWPHGRRRLDIGRTSRNELNVESQRRD